MDQQLFDQVFVERLASLQARLTHMEADNAGWIGGNAPDWFDDMEDQLLQDEQYGFYLTVRLPFCDDMCSVFLPWRFDTYSENDVYPSCAVKVFRHPARAESEKALYPLLRQPPAPGETLTRYQRSLDYTRPVLKKTWLSAFSRVEDGGAQNFVQLGGQPVLIQNEGCYTEALTRDGYQFFMQVDESFYLEDTVYGNAPFCFGALYLYANMDSQKPADIVAGFWQHS